MIDPKSSTPMYLQLSNLLSEQIKTGQYLPGDKLPSEHTLCREYGVSRITVRQAMNLLVQKDLAMSVHGKGTFVKAPTIDQELGKIVSFRHALQQKGLNGHTKVLSFQEGTLSLLGYAGQSPAVYYRSSFEGGLAEKMLRAALDAQGRGEAFSTFDLYDKLGIPLSRIQQTLGAMNATPELEKIMNVHSGQALLVLQSVYYHADGSVLEHKTGYYRADFYIFHLNREI